MRSDSYPIPILFYIPYFLFSSLLIFTACMSAIARVLRNLDMLVSFHPHHTLRHHLVCVKNVPVDSRNSIIYKIPGCVVVLAAGKGTGREQGSDRQCGSEMKRHTRERLLHRND